MAPMSNSKFRRSLAQSIVMVILIVAVMLFSQMANAQRSNYKSRFDKAKYRTTVHSNSGKACYILHKKRTTVPKHPLFAAGKRTKYRPMAETDQPLRSVASNY